MTFGILAILRKWRDELGELVLKGDKRATATLLE